MHSRLRTTVVEYGTVQKNAFTDSNVHSSRAFVDRGTGTPYGCACTVPDTSTGTIALVLQYILVLVLVLATAGVLPVVYSCTCADIKL